YHFQFVATSGAGTTFGPDMTFTTSGGAPSFGGVAVGPVTTTTANVSATINPNGLPTTYHVEYGPTTAYGLQTHEVSIGAGPTLQVVGAVLPGLAPNTAYHFRFVSTTSAGTTPGNDATVSTPAPPPPPEPAPQPPAAPPPPALPPPVQNNSVDVFPFLGPVF